MCKRFLGITIQVGKDRSVSRSSETTSHTKNRYRRNFERGERWRRTDGKREGKVVAETKEDRGLGPFYRCLVSEDGRREKRTLERDGEGERVSMLIVVEIDY